MRDPKCRGAVVEEVVAGLDELGLGVRALVASPMTGADGNVEFLAHARARPRWTIDAPTLAADRGAVRVTRAQGRRPGPASRTCARARARAARGRVVPRARRRGARAARGGRSRGTRASRRATRRSSSAGSISCISLGGDGTMLHTVQLVYPEPVPILGVNVGPARLPHRDRARRARSGAAPTPRRRLHGLGTHDARGRTDHRRRRAHASTR